MNNKIVKRIGSNIFLFVDGLPVLKLNETGAFITERVLYGKTVDDIAHELVNQYEIDFEEARNDVQDFFQNLRI